MASNGVVSNLKWSDIIATLTLIGGMFVGQWMIVQSQRVSDQERIADRFASLDREVLTARSTLDRNDASAAKQIKDINDQLNIRRHEFISTEQFSAFEKRVDQYMSTPFLRADAFVAWKDERDKLILQLQRQVEELSQQGKK